MWHLGRREERRERRCCLFCLLGWLLPGACFSCNRRCPFAITCSKFAMGARWSAPAANAAGATPPMNECADPDEAAGGARARALPTLGLPPLLPAAALATAAAATAPSAGWPKSPARLSHAHGIAANFGHLQATMQRERDRVGASAGAQSSRTVSGVRELAQQQEAEAGGIVRDRGGST